MFIGVKKYVGNELLPDTNHTFVIVGILQTKNCIHNNTIFEKKAMLNNGKEEIIYTYNIITKHREYYMEKVPWYKGICCCYF
tara:strand:+ start:31 stop:276 length:246 start_codon:yes stop_codon:yes gene_type:complete